MNVPVSAYGTLVEPTPHKVRALVGGPGRPQEATLIGWPNLALSPLATMAGESIQVCVRSETLARLEDPLRSLERLSQLERNWDSYDGKLIDTRAIVRAVEVLIRILSTEASSPSIVPTSEGGIQLEWHPDAADLEMSIHPDGTIDVYLETAGGQVWEGPLVDSRWQVEEFLAFVAERPVSAV